MLKNTNIMIFNRELVSIKNQFNINVTKNHKIQRLIKTQYLEFFVKLIFYKHLLGISASI